MPAGRRTHLPLGKKIELIQASRSGTSSRKLADQFQIGKTQVRNILKLKKQIISQWENGGSSSKKMLTPKVCKYPEINEAVFEWFCAARSKNIPVTGALIQEKAKLISEQLKLADFKASNGWLARWQARHNIKSSVLSGEGGAVDEETVAEWKQRLATLVEGFEPANIFNCDETGLYYRAMPTRSLVQKGVDKCKGGKHAKDRITVLLAVSATGEKLTPLVIGRSAKPRCFRGRETSTLPAKYEWNRKAWMTGTLFDSWLKQLNNKMRMQDRHILLLLDNCSCHTRPELSNVKLLFLPPNTTSKLQPLDAGIIQAVKLNYRKWFLRHLLAVMGQSEEGGQFHTKKVSVLDAIQWLARSWNELRVDTITKCFNSCGFNTSAEISEHSEEEPEIDFDYQQVLPLGVSLQDVAGIDNDVTTMASPDDMLSNLRVDQNDGHCSQEREEGVETEEEVESDTGTECHGSAPPAITYMEALSCAEKIYQYGLDNQQQNVLKLADKVQAALLKACPAAKLKQQQITNFFPRI